MGRKRDDCWLLPRFTATRTEAAKIGGVTMQIVRDWVLKFNAQRRDGLIDRKAPGQPSRLRDDYRQAAVELDALAASCVR